MKKQFYILIMLLLLPALSFGAAGKLSGVVTDKSTGEPLIGVNVVIEGTTLGASTDIDGYYVILNVPPGNYTVNFNYIGYTSLSYENIRVVSDITKRLDVAMEETTIELGEQIVVTADRPFFETSATNTVRVLDADEISRVPVKGINSVVSINAGVVTADGSGGATDNAVINVRGGRGNETLIVVDGIPYNDLLYGNALGTIPDGAVEQISSQLGGFSAKYGSAQSGVVNITTRSGSKNYFGSVEAVTSQALDDYGYNQVSATFGGPLLPGMSKISYFLSGEYIDTKDERPRASGLVVPSAGVDQNFLPDNNSLLWRFTGKVDANITTNIKLTGSFNGSLRKSRLYTHRYSKNGSEHNPIVNEDVFGGSLRLSQVLTETAFWDLTLRYKTSSYESGDGVWYDNLDAYGDTLAHQIRFPELEFWQSQKNDQGQTIRRASQGARPVTDDNGVFYDVGRVFNRWRQYEIQTGGADFLFTNQFRNHMVEIGGMFEQSIVRFFQVGPLSLANGIRRVDGGDSLTAQQRYFNASPFFYGYDITGQSKLDEDRFVTVPTEGGGEEVQEAGAKKPITAALFFQDRIEFQDFILNLGLRWDYFDPRSQRFKDRNNIFGFGNPTRLDAADLEDMPVESYLSPRIGLAFPVTQKTHFHAQYGVFRQQPRLIDLYDSWLNLKRVEQMDGQGQSNGWLQSESTTQYEFGFKRQIGNVASLDITAYYKNVKGLTNQVTIITQFGQGLRNYITSANTDFGTIKGFAFQFNLRRIGPLSAKIDYTFGLAEGTGSSQTSSFTATFRNPNNEVPKAIAPLNFDQRHTLTANLDIRSTQGQGPSVFGARLLENTGLNFLFTFNSGRPYTPLAFVNILAGTSNYGTVTQYINSATSASVLRLDLKLDRIFNVGQISLVPYLWVQNIFDTDNVVDVWESTGEPDNTAYLNTPEGEQTARSSGNPEGFRSDYRALERDPTNYGLPRMIRLGMRVQF